MPGNPMVAHCRAGAPAVPATGEHRTHLVTSYSAASGVVNQVQRVQLAGPLVTEWQEHAGEDNTFTSPALQSSNMPSGANHIIRVEHSS